MVIESERLQAKPTLTLERLRQVPLFAKLPADRMHWLMAQGTEVWLEPGQILRAQGELADRVFVLLKGEIALTKRKDNQDMLLEIYRENTLFGELPVLKGETHLWASGRAVTACHIFELGVKAFWDLLSSCPCVTTTILSTMAKRMQAVQSLSQHREKMVALGTLAAGLAHELNNPAAAAQRSTQQLRETSQTLQSAALVLGQLSCPQQDLIIQLRQDLMQRAANATLLDPLTQSDREDEVASWLQAQNVPDCWKLAPTLVTAGVDTAWLNQAAAQLPATALAAVCTWLEASLTELGLLNQLDHATDRISHLVKAVKDYSYMDQAPLQDIDVHDGLESTLTILAHKLKQGIQVIRDYDRQLPCITAYGSELNQVWTNLIDNAIDALVENGSYDVVPTIYLHTRRENDMILVEVADNGPGIPAEIRSQIFNPFFTTKGVGRGTGLGLHIAYRVIVEQHQGDLRVLSEPGNTRFQIRLPI